MLTLRAALHAAVLVNVTLECFNRDHLQSPLSCERGAVVTSSHAASRIRWVHDLAQQTGRRKVGKLAQICVSGQVPFTWFDSYVPTVLSVWPRL